VYRALCALRATTGRVWDEDQLGSTLNGMPTHPWKTVKLGLVSVHVCTKFQMVQI
jgi:hypothetical protein